MLPGFTYGSAIVNLWSTCLGLNISEFKCSDTLWLATVAMQATPVYILGIPSQWIVFYLPSPTIEEQSLNNLITACRDS